ncbi:TPA: hypothetical protein RUY73_002739 [Klebsiella pneumoniae]|uniref:hypothetical protein n=1 Tax=Klebsiella TaxID=570 RepID=UPI000B41C339|nr:MULTISPECIES: hypothetical protein [Klebsiella]DAL61827.1 MAG TPA_asm: hypothetical protein [Caudoviricetes sp.]HBS5431564.1 hypothetical protein [Klebsiella variicola subsp. variicola]EIV7911165.1 hypothetical protein [Klebsiella pneumoniae]EIW8656413.1 hypothetical protein [Klebsiella pneumoniae]EIY4986455.1 hypothetical protein [Klebsiella quasipneumoniae]
MAGLTKEQRAQRAAEQTASTQADNNVPVSTTSQLVAMVTDFPAFPGAPNTANVHPDEVENWKAHGWKEME